MVAKLFVHSSVSDNIYFLFFVNENGNILFILF